MTKLFSFNLIPQASNNSSLRVNHCIYVIEQALPKHLKTVFQAYKSSDKAPKFSINLNKVKIHEMKTVKYLGV